MKIITEQYSDRVYEVIESTIKEYATMRAILNRNGVAVHLVMVTGNECRWQIINPYKSLMDDKIKADIAERQIESY